MPKISVIMPVYNNEKYLAECIESVLNQEFRDIELICVNDGSTDRSLEIIKSYAKNDNRLVVITQSNQGVGCARNNAIKYAKGEWLAFCDGDDIVPRTAYRHFYSATNNVDVVVGEYIEIDDMGKELYLKCRRKHKNSIFYAMFMSPCVWNKLIRREFLLQYNIQFPNLLLGEDVVFLGEISINKPRVKIIEQCCYKHYNRILTDKISLTHKYDFIHFSAYIQCREMLLKRCWENAQIKDAYDYVCYEMMIPLLECMYRIQEFEEKERAFLLLQQYVQYFDWEKETDRFINIFGVSYYNFCTMDAYRYFTSTKILDHAEIVLKQYEAGTMGASYIVKYARAWIKNKVKKILK